MGERFVPVAYEVDDMTLGFDMTGSASSGRLNELPGVASRRGKMLGEPSSWGKWAHLLGRSVAFWKADTARLYVQAKLAPEGELCAPSDVAAAVQSLRERMTIVGLDCYEEPWVTRMDVAVDSRCEPEDGKLLLDALEAARLPSGWRTTWAGVPRSTVYFRARASEHVLARAYCRNLKTRRGEPFGRIRLEAEQRFKPRELMLERATRADYLAGLWRSRFCGLSSRVTRYPREGQSAELGRRMRDGELRYGAAERMSLFLDLETLGMAAECYPPSVYKLRRREAVKLGYGANESGRDGIEVELDELLDPFIARTLDLAA